MRFQVVKSRWLRQRWHFRIVAANGRILASSESYFNEGDCRDAVEQVRSEAMYASVFPKPGL